jgi:hypothetical protein
VRGAYHAAPVDVDTFEELIAAYLFERSEESRAVRVGEKEVSEQAAVVERHAGLFTRDQLASLRDAEDAATDRDTERVTRLRLTCEGGIAVRELAAREDALENAVLAARVPWQGEELPLRTAQARLATTSSYEDRDALGAAALIVSAGFNEERRSLLAAREELAADLSGQPDPIVRSEAEKGIRLRALLDGVDTARVETTSAYTQARDHWFDRLLGSPTGQPPSFAHVAWLRRLSPFAGTYTRERSVPVCVATLRSLGLDVEAARGIRLDLEDRPQKSPRACVIPSDPPRLVHLITRAQGGLHDYEAFLHEAGHALHYAGCDPGLPYTFRRLSRDHALTEIYSFLLDSIVCEPAWHAEHFGLDLPTARDHAAAARFVNTLLFRRYSAKLGFELEFWGRFAQDGATADGYSTRLTAATGIRYPDENYLADMDSGFYSADYLRAWVRSAQVRAWLRREVAADWWRRPGTGELVADLFSEGTRPSSEEIAARIGYDPLDTAPLVAELAAVS